MISKTIGFRDTQHFQTNPCNLNYQAGYSSYSAIDSPQQRCLPWQISCTERGGCQCANHQLQTRPYGLGAHSESGSLPSGDWNLSHEKKIAWWRLIAKIRGFNPIWYYLVYWGLWWAIGLGNRFQATSISWDGKTGYFSWLLNIRKSRSSLVFSMSPRIWLDP